MSMPSFKKDHWLVVIELAQTLGTAQHHSEIGHMFNLMENCPNTNHTQFPNSNPHT